MPSILAKFKSGMKVKVLQQNNAWDSVNAGDVGVVTGTDSFDNTVWVVFANGHDWSTNPRNLEIIPAKPEKRQAKEIKAKSEREKTAVRLIERVTASGFTALKVESEGRLNRRDRCDDNCSRRENNTPHDGCKYFADVKVANDFILKELAKIGLAKKCKSGDNAWSYLYRPVAPLMFSKVYTDSETEWTTTLLLARPQDVLFVPYIVDAFNALAIANGNGIDVRGSGMHTAFIEGENGYYPTDRPTADRLKQFKNFARSMRPLLPALYFLGANRLDEEGHAITRSTSPRQPIISCDEKYSAVAYRYGALEFRVFDTCYDNRDQLLDNVVVMAQAVSKYWKAKYAKPAIALKQQVYFGNSSCSNTYVNKLSSLYVIRDHIVLLNKGLRALKQPYYSVKEVKQQRHFSLTLRNIKDEINTAQNQSAYEEHLLELEKSRIIEEAHNYYAMLSELRYKRVGDLKAEIKRIHRKAALAVKKRFLPEPIECFAYKNVYGTSYSLMGEE